MWHACCLLKHELHEALVEVSMQAPSRCLLLYMES